MNTPVSFEIAKLLKEKGFEGAKSPLWYYKDGTLHETPTVGYKGLKCWNTWDATQGVRWDAPTIAEVVCWIYIKYNIWIQVSILKDDEWHYSIRRKENNWEIEFPTKEKISSIEKAYEAGIKYCLTKLI